VTQIQVYEHREWNMERHQWSVYYAS